MKYFILFILPLSIFAASFNAPMQKYIDELKNQAKKSDSGFVDFSASAGEKIFTSKHIGKKGKSISCTSCHSLNLKANGRNIHTNKVLKPLAPSINSARLTVAKDVKKWLRRNFKDVYVRAGTAKEKGDVLYYINSK